MAFRQKTDLKPRPLWLAGLHGLLIFAAIAAVSAAAGESSFSIVLLPDTQKYTESRPDIFQAQTEWIRSQVERQEIKFVIHLGDITEDNTPEQWKIADRAMGVLDGVVPYSVLPGNHDGIAGVRNTALYNATFSPGRFSGNSWYRGHKDKGNDCSYSFFSAAGMDFMVLSLPFGPLDEDLEWAARVIAGHPERRVIVATHGYVYNDDTRLGPGDDYSPHKKSELFNDGDQIWEKLVRHFSNIFLVVSGHVYGVGHLTSIGKGGNKVHEMLADYQKYPNGGDGWLRILKFDTGAGKIHVITYSPTLRKYNKDPRHTFDLDFNMETSGRKAGRRDRR